MDIKKIIQSANKMLAYDLIRIYIGIGLFLKGVQFITTPVTLSALMEGSQLQVLPIMIIHYISLAHLTGGFMLAIGILTRVAAIIQIPILLGATFLVNIRYGILSVEQQFEFSALVLILLILFSIFGAGDLSVDKSVFKHKD